jgi:exodeoxyribonuclease-5
VDAVPRWNDHRSLRSLWKEDDACRAAGDDTRERLEGAWQRLFQEDYPGKDQAIEFADLGDCFLYLFPQGRVAEYAFDGEGIYQVDPEAKGNHAPAELPPLREALATPVPQRTLADGWCVNCKTELPSGPLTAPADDGRSTERVWVCPHCDHEEEGAPEIEALFDDNECPVCGEEHVYGELVLAEDQCIALHDMLDAIEAGECVVVLKGPAGTGKTTLAIALSHELAERGWRQKFMAPTGKAAGRLSEVVKHPATTIHAALFKSVRQTEDGVPIFGDPQQLSSGRMALFCDEGSMLGRRLYLQMVNHIGPGVLIIMGDHEQLPPVADKWGPDFDNPTAELTQIHRQAQGNPIIAVATDVRNGKPLPKKNIGDAYVYHKGRLDLAARWLIREMEAGNDAIVLCWSNKTRQGVNRLVRHLTGRRAAGPLVIGERLVVLRNNRVVGRMNGETLTAEHVEDFAPRHGQPDQGVVLIRSGRSAFFTKPGLIGADKLHFDNEAGMAGQYTDSRLWVHLDYGYALTVHKAQGSEYRKVLFVIDRAMKAMARQGLLTPADARRLCYTAVTRAKEQVIVLDAT